VSASRSRGNGPKNALPPPKERITPPQPRAHANPVLSEKSAIAKTPRERDRRIREKLIALQGGDRAQPVNAGHMFHVSRRVLGVIAVIAIVLLVLGLATGVGLFGWVLALILGAYVVAALVMGRRGTA
jgi:Flp pilus assembly protein TadB